MWNKDHSSIVGKENINIRRNESEYPDAVASINWLGVVDWIMNSLESRVVAQWLARLQHLPGRPWLCLGLAHHLLNNELIQVRVLGKRSEW